MGWRGITIGVVVAALASGAWKMSSSGGGDVSEERLELAGQVMRGDLPISVVERGNLKAANSIELKSEIEGSTTILMLIEEGKYVEEGDLLCELDATGMVEKRVSQEITRLNGEASWIQSTQNLEIQRSQNESDRAAAIRKLAFAEIDLKKYTEGDWLNEEQTAKDNIVLAEEELKRAIDKLVHSTKLFDRGFITRTDFEGDELAKQSREFALEKAKRTLQVLTTYQHPRELQALEADVLEAKREIDRVELQSKARLVDYEAEVRSSLARFQLETEKYDRLETQIAKALIFAPSAGMVVYAQPEGGRMSSGEPLREGSSVRERQDIVTIPSSEGMVAEVSLHESVLEKVRVGMECTVKVDALGDLELPGRVKFKAVLPDRNSWMANPNQRLYRTEIAIEDSDERMRPGMSCSIEIHVETVRDTLYIPVQSIFRDGGETISFVLSLNGAPRKASIEVGSFSHLWAQVTSGLAEGDRVALSLPPGQALVPAPSREMKVRDSGEMPESAMQGKPTFGGDKGGKPGGDGPKGSQWKSGKKPAAAGDKPVALEIPTEGEAEKTVQPAVPENVAGSTPPDAIYIQGLGADVALSVIDLNGNGASAPNSGDSPVSSGEEVSSESAGTEKR
jgi:multidrug resistance efflux pump